MAKRSNAAEEAFSRRLLVESARRDDARMEVKDPELLRATAASSALQWFGQVLRTHFEGDLYHSSFPTERIDCFWSHSWHGSWAARDPKEKEKHPS